MAKELAKEQDLEMVLLDAELAQQQASEAAARATQLREQADAAQRRVLEQQQANRRRYSESVVTSFQAASEDADKRYFETYYAFTDAAASADFGAAIQRFLDWKGAGIEEYYIYQRFLDAMGFLGRETYNGASLPSAPNRVPYSFTQSLDKALEQVLTDVSTQVAERLQAGIQAAMQGTGIV